MAGPDLKAFQDRPDLTIRVSERRSPIDSSQGIPRRLDDFLWHLGLHAGSGSLLPWLDEREAFRIKRWPPLFSNDSRNQAFRVAALLCRGAKKTDDIAKTTGMPLAALADFLNACSLVDCLEAADTSQALVAAESDIERAPAPADSSETCAAARPLQPASAAPSRGQGWLLMALELVFLMAGLAALYTVLAPRPAAQQAPPAAAVAQPRAVAPAAAPRQAIVELPILQAFPADPAPAEPLEADAAVQEDQPPPTVGH
jgi:hypothetical protein